MSTSKIMILVVVVIVVLYSVGIAMGQGLGRNEPKPGTPTATPNTKDATLGRLQDLLANPQPLKAADITLRQGQPSSCLQGNSLVILWGSTCRYTIKPSGSPFGAADRRLSFPLRVGSWIEVTVMQPQGLAVKRNIPDPQASDYPNQYLDFYKDGGSLDITCVTPDQANNCVIPLQ